MKNGLIGIDEVMRKLNKEVDKIKERTLKGLILAAIEIRRSMEDTSPKIPVDLGNLRASWFVVTGTGEGNESKPSFKGKQASELAGDHSMVLGESKSFCKEFDIPFLVMGFTANYAIFVHENVGANFKGNVGKIKYTKGGKITASTKKYTRREGAGAKFFESALNRNHKRIVEIIKLNAKIK